MSAFRSDKLIQTYSRRLMLPSCFVERRNRRLSTGFNGRTVRMSVALGFYLYDGLFFLSNYFGLSRGTAEECEYVAVLRVCLTRRSVPPLRSGSTGLRPKQLAFSIKFSLRKPNTACCWRKTAVQPPLYAHTLPLCTPPDGETRQTSCPSGFAPNDDSSPCPPHSGLRWQLRRSSEQGRWSNGANNLHGYTRYGSASVQAFGRLCGDCSTP